MSDPSSPSWLQPVPLETSAPASTAAITEVPLPPAATNNGLSTSAANGSSSTGEDAELPGVILTMRLANMAAAGGLISVSIWLMTTIPSVSAFVLAIYATCGACLICCLETQLKFLRVMIAVNFGFLFNSAWRFFFYLLLASIAWSYDNIPGKIVGAAFCAVAFYNTYVLCRYPSYRKMREKIAEEEDKRIEARISKEVKRQVARQVMK